MKSYAPMSKNEYKKFQNYPKNVASEKVKEIDIIRAEQKALDEKLNEMESAEKAINSRLHNHLMDEEYSKRMRGIFCVWKLLDSLQCVCEKWFITLASHNNIERMIN